MTGDRDHSSRPESPADVLRRELRTGLKDAMRKRDPLTVAALRSALSAIDNAEAADEAHAPKPTEGHATLAGTVAGLGAGEVERQILSEADLELLLETEITDRDHAAETYRRSGKPDMADMADRLQAEADVLRPYLPRRRP